MNIRAVQRNDVVYKNGCSPLFLRFSHERKNKFVSLGISILPEFWDNEAQFVRSDCPENKSLNLQIARQQEDYRKRIAKLEVLEKSVNFETLFGEKGKRINCTVADYFNQQIERLKSSGRIASATKYRFCLSALEKCCSVGVRFEQVDMGYLRAFETYLLGKDNTSNSVATKFSVFKAVYNRAVTDGVFEPKENPFTKFKVGKYWKPTRKRAISKEDILKLKALELSKGNSFYLEFSRDIFLFSYYTAGINFKDIATLKWSDIVDGRIYYQRHKTRKDISCQLLPEARQIMERYGCPFYEDNDYIFPILDRRVHLTEQQIFNRVHKVMTKVNTNLKQISKTIGVKIAVTTYVARHSYATVLKRSGVNVALISESLGHSDLPRQFRE